MRVFCIPPSIAENMKKAVRNGDIKVKDLYEMSTLERRGVFEKFATKELAQNINTAFEKAIVSKQQDALKKWAESVFTPQQKTKSEYKSVIEKINDLENLGVLNDVNSKNFLGDLVANKLGVEVTPAEIKTITEKANKLEAEFEKKTEDGIPSVDYWVARKEMDDYIHSLVPAHPLKVATSISGRGAMLLSIKSPLTNIISNTVMGAVQGLERRMASGTYKGLNNEFALQYVKKVNDIYAKSGFDISRMESLASNQVRLGEEIVSAQGPGKVRAVGRWYEDVVFKKLMGGPDTASSSVAFADSANLASTKLSGGSKAKALEIFKDATSLEPKTVEGEIVRSQAIADARYSTYTNKGGYSDLAMAIRSALNNATGNLRLGDQLMPFVKTPANVLQAGIDAAGVGFFKGFARLPKALAEMKVGNKAPMEDVVRLFVRSGLGMTLATTLVYMFNPDDFVGEYDSLSQKERDLANLKNAPYNSIKMGDKYVSLDYFGPLAASFVGLMYARKYGDTLPEKVFQYGRGVATQAVKVPGLREFSELVGNISDAVKRGDLAASTQGLANEVVAYIRARVVPAIVNDFAKGTDENERQTDKGALSKLKATIPGVRQTLPEKIDQTSGETMKTEGLISTLLFGSRVKTAKDNPVVNEINRLHGTDNTPVTMNIEKASSRFKELKKQIPQEQFQEALVFYGSNYKAKAERAIGGSVYQSKSDEDKKKALNKIREDVLDRTLKMFHYKKPTKNQSWTKEDEEQYQKLMNP